MPHIHIANLARNLKLNMAHRSDTPALQSLNDEPAEFARFQVSVPELERITRDLGTEWISAPIVDTSIPDAPFLELWRATGPRLRRIVDEGGAVVFHCLGGLGRSGTMAACVLIETGYGAADAVAAVRRARPGAIENDEQESFVLGYVRVTELCAARS